MIQDEKHGTFLDSGSCIPLAHGQTDAHAWSLGVPDLQNRLQNSEKVPRMFDCHHLLIHLHDGLHLWKESVQLQHALFEGDFTYALTPLERPQVPLVGNASVCNLQVLNERIVQSIHLLGMAKLCVVADIQDESREGGDDVLEGGKPYEGRHHREVGLELALVQHLGQINLRAVKVVQVSGYVGAVVLCRLCDPRLVYLCTTDFRNETQLRGSLQTVHGRKNASCLDLLHAVGL